MEKSALRDANTGSWL